MEIHESVSDQEQSSVFEELSIEGVFDFEVQEFEKKKGKEVMVQVRSSKRVITCSSKFNI